MREDMDKVICERPRAGHKDGKRSSRHVRRTFKHELSIADKDAFFDIRTGISSHVGHPKRGSKEFNEHLNPLFRFLNKQVGRLWNDVFAEICEGITLDSTVQRHIREHVFDQVEVNIKIIDGKPYEFNSYAHRRDGAIDGWIRHQDYKTRRSGIRSMYVDPQDGTLKFSPIIDSGSDYHQREQDFISQNRRTDSKNPLIQYLRIKGVWYEIGLRKPTKDEMSRKSWGEYKSILQPLEIATVGLLKMDEEKYWATRSARNVVHPQVFVYHTLSHSSVDWTWNNCSDIFGEPLLPISKRQMNSQEIKRMLNSVCFKNKAA